MNKAIITVGYSPDQLRALVSCGEIADGHIRGVLRRNGRLFAITGACYGPNGAHVFYACEAIPLALYPDATKTYAERYREFDAFDATPDAEHRTVGERLRHEGRVYEGVRVHCKHEAYVLGREREHWQCTCSLTQQGTLL